MEDKPFEEYRKECPCYNDGECVPIMEVCKQESCPFLYWMRCVLSEIAKEAKKEGLL